MLYGGHDELKVYEDKFSVPWLPRCAFFLRFPGEDRNALNKLLTVLVTFFPGVL